MARMFRGQPADFVDRGWLGNWFGPPNLPEEEAAGMLFPRNAHGANQPQRGAGGL